jgi:RNA polymerase sigma factor (sigma-70 family)
MRTRFDQFVGDLRKAVLRQGETALTDRQLLGRLIEERDEAAFAALLRRHGPMVWGVCRRVLRNHHDAEDAFQATFLVLIRKACSVRPREMVGNWLYRVAQQTAFKARAMLARRQRREAFLPDLPAAESPASAYQEFLPVLDLELSCLPARYRAAIVLCDLEGKTRKEAARQLGLPEGTVAGHLTRGRSLLARRLARHGVVLSSAALATALSGQAATAAVPPLVLALTLKAMSAAVGKTVFGAAISAQVATLTQGVIKAMLLTKLKSALACSVVVCVLGTGVGATILAGQEQPGENPAPSTKRVGKATPPADFTSSSTKEDRLAEILRRLRELEMENRRLTAELDSLKGKMKRSTLRTTNAGGPAPLTTAPGPINTTSPPAPLKPAEPPPPVAAGGPLGPVALPVPPAPTVAVPANGAPAAIPPARSALLQVRIISLSRNIGAEGMAKMLELLFNSPGQPKMLFIAPSATTASIILRGRAEDLDAAEAMIERLETHAAKNVEEIRRSQSRAK